VPKVVEFCQFYKKDGLPGRSQSDFTFGYAATRGEDGLPGRSQRRSLEPSDTLTLGTLNFSAL